MRVDEFRRAGHTPSLLAALVHFDVSFMAWVLLGALGTFIAEDLALTATETGLMVAVPLLSAAGFRIALGVLGDRFGPKRVGTVSMAVVLAPRDHRLRRLPQRRRGAPARRPAGGHARGRPRSGADGQPAPVIVPHRSAPFPSPGASKETATVSSSLRSSICASARSASRSAGSGGSKSPRGQSPRASTELTSAE